MSLSIRDVAIPPEEVPSIVKPYQIQLYLSLIPAAILIYDTRASLLPLLERDISLTALDKPFSPMKAVFGAIGVAIKVRFPTCSQRSR